MTTGNTSTAGELHADVLSLDMPPVRRRLQALARRVAQAVRLARRRSPPAS